MSYMDQTRLIVARLEGERYPCIVGAMAMSTWEIIPVEDWDEWKRKRVEDALGPDWQSYDVIEVVMTFPAARLNEMFEAQQVEPVSLTKAED